MMYAPVALRKTTAIDHNIVPVYRRVVYHQTNNSNMKPTNQNTILITAAVLLTLGIGACKYSVKDLGAKPAASFTVTPVSGQTNKYLLTSTSTNSFRYDWDKGTGAYVASRPSTDTVYFPDRGNYTVRLLVFGQSGVDSARQTINVPNDDPAAITPQKILTGNSTKTWILDQPGAGALFVGDPGGAQWWANSAGDVTAADRTCLFNDEYTFKMDGSFNFDDKGDLRVDDEGGNPWPADMAGPGTAIACYPAASIQTQYRSWGTGNFTYQVIGTNQLRVVGTGAHLGLYKAGRNGTIAAPETENTYEILELTPTRLVVRKMYSWGQWKFTFKPKP
jgi:PKD repeat protein